MHLDMRNFAVILFALFSFTAFAAIHPAQPPQTANEYFQIGFAAANNGQYDVAIKNYSQAIDLDPKRVYFFYHRGIAYNRLGDKASAVTDFTQCLTMRPLAEAYYELGVIKYEKLEFASAQQSFDKSKELKDDVEKVNYYLGVLNYRSNNFDAAEALLTHYTHQVRTNPDAFLYLAMTKVKQHKYNEVSSLLKIAALYSDNDWKFHLTMYDIYKEIGDKDNMFYHISMVIELGHAQPEYNAIRAQLGKEREDNPNAADIDQSAVADK